MTVEQAASPQETPSEEQPEVRDFPLAEDALLEPVSDAEPAGSDPRYEDDFATVRDELEKLSGTDFQEVARLTRGLLNDHSKDIRLVGYLALSALETEGLAGLAAALDTGAAMIERFSDACHPRREKARTMAVRWFDADRFEQLLTRKGTDCVADDWEPVDQAGQRFREQLATLDLSVDESLAVIRRWVKKQQARAPRKPSPAESAPKPASVAVADKPQGETQSAVVESERGFNRTGRALIEWLMEQDNWAGAVAQARILRWSGQSLPPAENGRTLLPGPRDAGLASVDQAMDAGDWASAFRRAEAAFLEPGGHLCFRLQRQAHLACQRMERTEVVRRIEYELRWLLDRHPGLLDLQFEDGRPFADAADREWIDEVATADAGSRPSTSVDHSDELAEIEARARAAAEKQGLAAGFEVLDELALQGERERARLTVVRAQLAARMDNPALAVALTDRLIRHLERVPAIEWDNELVAEITSLALRTVNGLRAEQLPPGRDLKSWPGELRQRLAAVAPNKAIALF